METLILSLGIWPLFAWSFIVHRLYSWDAVRPFDLCAGLALTVAGTLSLTAKHRLNKADTTFGSGKFATEKSTRPVIDAFFAALFFISGIMFASICLGPDAISTPPLLLTLAGGVAYGWFYLRLLCRLSDMCLRDAIATLCASCSFWVLTQMAVDAFGTPLKQAMLVAIPIAVFASICCSEKRPLPRLDTSALRFTASDLLHMPKVWTVSLAVSFLTSFSIPVIRGLDNAPAPMFVGRVLTVAILAGLYMLTRRRDTELRFSTLWRIVCITLCAAYATLGVRCLQPVSEALLFITWDITVPIGCLTLADISRHADVPKAGVLGITRGCGVIASALGGSIAPAVSEMLELGEIAAIASFLTTLLLATCLTSPGLLASRIFEDLRVIPPSVEDRVLHARCDKLAEEAGLTDRERQVVFMIAEGKSRAYIAETMIVSENTVKSHTAHVYEKLGVHSKKELRELIG